MLDLHCHAGFSLVVERGGYSLAMVLRFLAARWRLLLWSTGSGAHRLQWLRLQGSIHGVFFFSFIFISWRLITLQYCSGSRVLKRRLNMYMGLVAPWHVASSWIRAWTRVFCISWQILYHSHQGNPVCGLQFNASLCGLLCWMTRWLAED